MHGYFLHTAGRYSQLNPRLQLAGCWKKQWLQPFHPCSSPWCSLFHPILAAPTPPSTPMVESTMLSVPTLTRAHRNRL
ncbi:hypothetical protein HU200_002837 [Digitaria exilis]|uniref:Uncharacterized protein n=1 Tax=Digitaria exilis TaxID=1010633 RepID=A0A835FXP7_9POAL|nr:hypothetical protein HU200_002837 [Digitaria exilis]